MSLPRRPWPSISIRRSPVSVSLDLAAALAERAMLITADEVFAAAAARHGLYASAVKLLGA